MPEKQTVIVIFSCLLAFFTRAQEVRPDVLNYHLTITPDLHSKRIEGAVEIEFEIMPGANKVHFDAGNLEIHQVTGTTVRSFKKTDQGLIVNLEEDSGVRQKLTITYHGPSGRGLLFNGQQEQVHTLFFTEDWMVCNQQPDDKATISMDILVPKGKQCIASGELIEIEERENRKLYRFDQTYETPAYTYGFVIGSFTEVHEQAGEVMLRYYSAELDKQKLQTVFRETPNIIKFFENKTDIPYPQKTYSQVLIGSSYQEMSGFSTFNPSYVKAVLRDSSEIHLTSHELAHQWWGNMITCKDYSHFWLNEAFAVYMASAFNEYKFGKEKYLADITLYKGIYDKLVERGADKPLVFSGWKPTRDNRHVVYYKGAYVLHLLREKIGEQAFWEGIRTYSQSNYGRSVETKDFKMAMEKAANVDLDQFFYNWITRP